MSRIRKLCQSKWFLISLVLLTVLVLMCLNATRSGLSYDESIEYYYSGAFVGEVPGGQHTVNMYERVARTFQPPLYNFVMHFWLLVFDSEFGFRLAGILTTLVGGMGLYLALRRLTGSSGWSAGGTAVYLMSGLAAYYALDCSEYNLALCMLCWTVYFYVRAVTEERTPQLAGFFVFACLSVYSQYGAALAVAPMYAALVLHFLRKKEKIRELLILSGLALLAAVPLVVFFILPQMDNQGTTGVSHRPVFFKGNPLVDFFLAAARVCSLLSGSRLLGAGLCLCIAGAVAAPFLLKKGKTRSLLLHLLFLLIGTWLLYYAAVACSFYAYNYYRPTLGTSNIQTNGGRYNLVLVPFLTLFATCGLSSLVRTLGEKAAAGKKGEKAGKLLTRAVSLCLALAVLVYCGLGARGLFNIQPKEDIREIESLWMEEKAYEKTTLVHQWAEANFQFYLTHDPQYDAAYQNSIVNSDVWIRLTTEEELEEMLPGLGVLDLDEFYYVSAMSAWPDSHRDLISVAEKHGFRVEVLYEGISSLVHVSKP